MSLQIRLLIEVATTGETHEPMIRLDYTESIIPANINDADHMIDLTRAVLDRIQGELGVRASEQLAQVSHLINAQT